VGDIVGLPFLAAQLIQMMREDQVEARLIDAELDAAEPALAETGPAGTGPAGTGPASAGQAAMQPWWETDRRFADRFRAVDEPE
jgi:hypothetical protein